MSAVWTVLWMIGAAGTARGMYQQWRCHIIEKPSMNEDLTRQARCVWAAIGSLFICLMCWWLVLIVLAVMARPKLTPSEQQAAVDLQKQKVADLEREDDALRQQLAKYKAEVSEQNQKQDG